MTNRSTAERPYLSIGEVLGLLLEEFPDVTISKIRFLESQGLIVPERTASGYRKFYDEDVELLRYILREQKEHFLPLRVIKDRLETPPEGLDRPPPRGTRSSSPSIAHHDRTASIARNDVTSIVDRTQTLSHPAAQRTLRAVDDRTRPLDRPPAPIVVEPGTGSAATYSRREIVAVVDCDPQLVRELERFGMIEGRQIGDETIFDEEDLSVCKIAKKFEDAGLDIRHLRAWKTASDREAGLFEQRVLPIVRKRTPEAREEANRVLDELNELGSQLREILMSRALSGLREVH